jgi:hypothetical protein
MPRGHRAVGLEPPDEVAFDDPAAGTLLMQVDPRVGLDLPCECWPGRGRADRRRESRPAPN